VVFFLFSVGAWTDGNIEATPVIEGILKKLSSRVAGQAGSEPRYRRRGLRTPVPASPGGRQNCSWPPDTV